jgi:hypothetical protein
VPAHRLRAYQPARPVNLAKMARKRAQQTRIAFRKPALRSVHLCCFAIW